MVVFEGLQVSFPKNFFVVMDYAEGMESKRCNSWIFLGSFALQEFQEGVAEGLSLLALFGDCDAGLAKNGQFMAVAETKVEAFVSCLPCFAGFFEDLEFSGFGAEVKANHKSFSYEQITIKKEAD